MQKTISEFWVKKLHLVFRLKRFARLERLEHFEQNFALKHGYDIRTVQELLDHRDISTTMIYTHVLNRGGRGVNSPADRL